MEILFGKRPSASGTRAILTLAKYEIQKNIRKLLVIALIILGALSVLGSVMIVNLILSSPEIPEAVKAPFMRYKWYVVMSMPQFFISLVSIAVGAGLFASEYEDRSAYILYSRPLTRLNIFISKFLGGYALITSLTLLYAALSIGISMVFFGDIEGIWVAPYVALAMVFAQLIIYSITYMFSQLTRRTILAMIIGIAIILISPIVESMLLTLDFLSGWLGYIIRIFPTWAMGLPEFVASELLPDFISLGGAGDIPSAIIVIVGYFLLTSSITVYSLMKRDLVTD